MMCCVMQRYVVVCCVVEHYVVLGCVVSCSIMFCCVVLYCAMLCCCILFRKYHNTQTVSRLLELQTERHRARQTDKHNSKCYVLHKITSLSRKTRDSRNVKTFQNGLYIQLCSNMQAHIGSAVQVVLSSDLKQPTSEFQVITHKHLPVLFQCCQPQTQQTTYEDTANFKPYS